MNTGWRTLSDSTLYTTEDIFVHQHMYILGPWRFLSILAIEMSDFLHLCTFNAL